MTYVSANNIDIYYERRGNGPRLLFLNGSGTTLATTGFFVDVFAANFDVVAHDQRGLGRTTVPQGPYTMAEYASDAIAVIDDVGWDACAVVGISFGGMVAQELAVTVPTRVTRLALACTSSGGQGGSSYPLHELAELSTEAHAALSMQLMDTRFNASWLSTHPSDKMLAEAMAAGRALAKTAEQLRGEYEQLQARRHHDVFDRLHEITAPTIVASGRYDAIAPPSNGQAIAQRIPNSTYREYEGGHAFFAQDRSAFSDIAAFLSND